MSGRAERGLPVAIEQVRMKLEGWREGRRRGQRIPVAVWQAAVRAAQRHGVHRVSRELGLDYVRLKRRVAEGTQRGTGEQGEAVFVELDGVRGTADAACVVELEKGNGTRMRICVRDGATVDWCRMKEAFLGA